MVFSPNTQPDPDTAEGQFHTWVATSGVWRYDDDAGGGGELRAQRSSVRDGPGRPRHRDIAGIYVSAGFSADTNLSALLREWKFNETTYSFGS